MKRIIALLITMIMLLGLISCGGGGDTPPENPPADTGSGSGANTGSGGSGGSGDNGNGGGNLTDDPQETPPEFDELDIPTVSDALKDKLDVFNEVEYVEQSQTTGYKGAVDVDVSLVANNATHKIGEGGAYRLFGKSLNGCIYVEAEGKDVYLILDGVDLTNTGSAPAIYSENCKSLTVILAANSVNYLRDSSKNGENGVLRVRSCNLTLDGKGTLNIVANKKNGISSTKEITIKGGTYNITTPATEGHGIFGKLGINIVSGNFTINSGKSGFKSGDVEDNGEIVKGYITVKYTKANVICGTNAFNCQGPVAILGGYINIKAEGGNGIDATEAVDISTATIVINSGKSGIATDTNVTITENANLSIETNGNGISCKNISIHTNGVIYIKTAPIYEEYIKDDSNEEKDLYVYENGEYIPYDESKHSSDKLYERRNCKGLNADEIIDISNALIGIDSYEDAINTDTLQISDATVIVNTLADGVEAKNVTLNAVFTVLNSEKGIRGESLLQIDGGTVTVNAVNDSLNSDNTVINGGTVYLFDKIDKGNEGGDVKVNGGTIIMLSTTKAAQFTNGTQKYRSGKITNKNLCKEGSWIKITSTQSSVVLYLPKDFSNNMAFYYSAADASTKVTVEFGTYENGEAINPFVYTGGTFTAEESEQI